MFTGLIESVGTVAGVERRADGIRLRVETSLAPELTAGESLSVSGVCLTVVAPDAEGIHADVSPETARVTTIGDVSRGALVNLERSMRADARVGGHFVQGHVDATGAITAIRQEGDSYRVTVSLPSALEPLVVNKGSIAIDGISLTVASIGAGAVDVQIIPFTWLHTNLNARRTGDPVNIECDILGKYVVRALSLRDGRA
jgi:riboflavin synthase